MKVWHLLLIVLVCSLAAGLGGYATGRAHRPPAPDTVDGWVERFPLGLAGWTVAYHADPAVAAECHVQVYRDRQIAEVWPCPGANLARHTLEEVLHVVLAAACKDRNLGSEAREEMAVDELQRLILGSVAVW